MHRVTNQAKKKDDNKKDRGRARELNGNYLFKAARGREPKQMDKRGHFTAGV